MAKTTAKEYQRRHRERVRLTETPEERLLRLKRQCESSRKSRLKLRALKKEQERCRTPIKSISKPITENVDDVLWLPRPQRIEN